MKSVNRAVFKALAKSNDFCCLCFNTIKVNEEIFHIHDRVYWEQTDSEVSNLIYHVLGSTVLNHIITDYICNQCSHMLIKSYNFIITCKQNSEHLCTALNSLHTCLENTLPDIDKYKSLYVSLDAATFTSEQFYDDRPAVTSSTAIKRFEVISNPKISKPKTKAIKKMSPGRRGKDICTDIPTRDMMLDPSNVTNYQCRECHKVFPRSYNLRQHYVRVHAPKDFKCMHCSKTFGALSILKLHKVESHTPSECNDCGKKFNTVHGLKMHQAKHKNRYVCQKCGKVYQTAEFECDYCNKKFCTKNYLMSHIKYEHENGVAHVCKWCNKRFYAKSSLIAHIVTHTREKNFCCDLCGGRFIRKESLAYHKRIHTGEKPYKCEHCDARFLSSSRKVDHMRRHHLEPSLQCEQCNVKVKTLSSLAVHKKKHYIDFSQTDTNLVC